MKYVLLSSQLLRDEIQRLRKSAEALKNSQLIDRLRAPKLGVDENKDLTDAEIADPMQRLRTQIMK